MNYCIGLWEPGYSDGIRVERPLFGFLQWRNIFPLFHSIQTVPVGAHPVSCPAGTMVISPRGVKRPVYEANHILNLMPRSRIVELYLHSPYAFIISIEI
jgi:hypothetical protein